MLFAWGWRSKLEGLVGLALLAAVYFVAPNVWNSLIESATGADGGSLNLLQIGALVVLIFFGITFRLWIWDWIPSWLEERRRFKKRQQEFYERRGR